jgi:hypothetical protein
MTFIVATELIDVGTSAAELGLTSLMVRYTDAVRRSVGVAQSSAVNGRCGIRLAPRDRRPRRRRGRPLWSLLGPWPSIDGRRRCEKSRVGDR